MITIDVSAGVNVSAGLGRYTRSLVNEMLPMMDTTPTLFYNHIKGRSQFPREWETLPTKHVNWGYKPWRMAVLMGQHMRLPFNRLVPKTTVFHATEHLLMPLGNTKTVMTVHDLIFKLFPEHHKRLNYWYLNHAMPLFVSRADHVIAISEATKRDLIQYYNTPTEKITVIYEAAAPHFKPQSPETISQVKKQYNLPEQYIVVVGTIEPRKNYSRLLEAIHHLKRDFPDVGLVVVGSKGWLYEPFLEKIRTLNAEPWVHFPGFIPDEDLPAIYAGATLMAMPSIYEGFGLPILEAMQCGTPVVSSNAASLPELGGNAALYFSPTNIDEMVQQIKNVIEDAQLQDIMRQKGYVQAQRFSWKQAAIETLSIYKMLQKD